MRKLFFFTFFLFLFGCVATTKSVRLPDKVIGFEIPSISVGAFDNKAGSVYGWSVGQGLQEQLIHQLTSSQYFNVLNRQYIQDAVTELNIQNSGLTRQQGKIQPGNMKNARYIIRGAVTSFEQTNDATLWAFFKDAVFDADHQLAQVQINLYVEDMEQNQVIASTTVTDTVSATNISYRGIVFGGSAFFKTPLGEATQEVINQAVDYVIAAIPKQAWYPVVAQQGKGQTRFSQGERLYLSGGVDRGIELNSLWQGFEPGQAIIDPVTGDVLGMAEAQISDLLIKITQVHNRHSVAQVLKGEINVGQRVKRQVLVANRP